MSFEFPDDAPKKFDWQVTLRRPADGPQTFTARFDELGSPHTQG